MSRHTAKERLTRREQDVLSKAGYKMPMVSTASHASSPRVEGEDTGDDVHAVGRDDRDHHLRKHWRPKISNGLHGAKHSTDQHTAMSDGIVRDSLGGQNGEEVHGGLVLPGRSSVSILPLQHSYP